jgi:hypothetical protein
MSSPALSLRSVLAGGLVLFAAACEEQAPEVVTEALGVLDEVVLTDADNAQARLDLRIEQQTVAALTDVVIDWSMLEIEPPSPDAQPVEVSHRASLRYFPLLDVEELTQGLAAGTLVQSDVGVDVTCESADLRCPISAFAFDESHAFDVVALFGESTGTWLVSIRAASSADVVAYLTLAPSADSAATVAQVTSDSTTTAVEVSPSARGPLAVAEDGYVALDWSGLTRTARGLALQPYQIDRLSLAFLPGVDPADPGADLLEQQASAAEVWSAPVEGQTRFALPELAVDGSDEIGFPGFEGEGAWVLSLWASSTGDPSPAFVTTLQPVSAETH